MTTLTSLARAEAVRAGIAAPITTVRHVHIHRRPLVLIPLALAGEANAPLAAMIGDDRTAPRLLVVAQPRDRDLRLAFAAELATIVLAYVGSFATDVEVVSRGRDIGVRYRDAPQVVVPNRGGIEFVRRLGRSTRFRRDHGSVAVGGQWLTFLAERADHPGSSLLVAATDALAMHWATGQSAIEDQNLGALLGWIDPPSGRTGRSSAAAAEDPRICPPAGPATDPGFDNDVLAPLVRAGDGAALGRALHGQIAPTWSMVWAALDRLSAVAPGERVADRWGGDKDAYTAYVTYVRDGGRPQPRQDGAVAAAQRLDRWERAEARFAAQRALDDPLVFAEHRLAGVAFAGVVTATEPDRLVGSRPRPLVTVTTADPVRLAAGTALTAAGPAAPGATLVGVRGEMVLIELSSGLGRTGTPPPGSVPAVGDEVRYTSVTGGFRMAATFPHPDDTPWTHGGPPSGHAERSETPE